ncbi:MAG: ribonuclease HII [Nitrospiria bacterium]
MGSKAVFNRAVTRHRLFSMGVFERALASFGKPRVCGIDEAGRGPLAGPVVAAAVILPPGCLLPGIRDSKKLSPRQREILFEQVSREASSIGIGIVDNDTIDEINILKATILAMQKSVAQMELTPDYLLIDALTLPDFGRDQKGIVHGDSLSISIAAASVIAKVTRDRLMCEYHEEFPRYNFNIHKGYGTASHLSKIRAWGPCRLHRKTFRGVVL